MVGSPYDLLHALEFLGQALDAEAVDIPFEIALVYLQEVGRDHLRLVADLARGHGNGSACNRRRARTKGADTVGRRVGVALFHHDVIGWDADFGSEDLGIGRLVPLALRFAAHARDRRARGVHADLAAVEHGEPEYIAVLGGAGPHDLCKEA